MALKRRVSIHGVNEAADLARELFLVGGGARLVERGGSFQFTVQEDAALEVPVVDGVDSALEARFVTLLCELTPRGRVTLQRAGGNRDEHALVVTVPATNDDRQACATAIYRSVVQLSQRKRRWWLAWLPIVALLIAAPASGQIIGGTVDQGTGGSSAWKVTFGGDPQPVSGSGSFTVVFGSAQHIICDSGCGGAAAFADASAFTFGTTGISNIGFVVDDVGTNTVAENSSGTPRMSTNRVLYVDLSKTTANATAITVTANAGTNLNTSALALSATQTDRTQKAQITDGTRDGTVKAASTAAVATDTSLVVTLSPNSPLPAGTAVIGALSANQSTNVAQFGGTNVVTGTGASGVGVPRVTIANDSSLAANQSVNVAQIAGVATSTGVGASGTGTQRTATLIHDGTDTAQVTTTSGGSLQTECTAGCIQAVASPVSISVNESVVAPFAATWYVKRRWVPPGGTHFIPSRVSSVVTTAGSRTYIGEGLKLATWNENTNAFTDGSAVVTRHFSRVYAIVTTARAATANTITVTYTSEVGTAGRAATCTMPAAALSVGTAVECTLAVTTGQENDTGVRDVTAVADSAAPATGIVELWGMNTLLDALGNANSYEQSDYDISEVSTTETLFIMFNQAATTAQQRGALIAGSIR